ncbi:MAG: MFS transporter, partial [Chloroflexota bacterium]
IGVLWSVGNWYRAHRIASAGKPAAVAARHIDLTRATVVFSVTILMALVLSKSLYITSLNSYYTFFLIERFGLSVPAAQIYLFVLLFSVAAGTLLGGLVTDRVGRKNVIWFSILGAAPFTLLLPYANLEWTGILTVVIGLITAAAFPALIVYAQDLLPGRVGLVAGLFFGLAFGFAGLGAAVLGKVADITDIAYVYKVCSFIPLLGLLTAFLPNIEKKK